MKQKVFLFGRKALPAWLLVVILVVSGAGAAAGTVLAGKVTGEVPVAVSQALLVGEPYCPNDSVELGTKGDGSSSFSTDQAHTGSYSLNIDSGLNTGAGDEGRIVITMPAGTTLNDLDTISWWVYSLTGSYPPHLDITIDCNGDGIVDDEDMLTAEMANNNIGGLGIIALQGAIAYNTWLQTFETTAGDGFHAIDDTTIFWVTKLGAGTADAPWGTLAQWKAGVVANDPQPDGLGAGVITGDCPIVKLEIEVDNWIADSEVYFDDLEINGTLYPMHLGDLVGNNNGVPQGSQKVYVCPNRYFGAVADDNTGFQFASEIAVGDLYLIALPLKNASENELVAMLTMDVPDCLEVEVISADQVHGIGNVTEAVRINCNQWKITVLPDAHYNSPMDNLYIAVQADDVCAPGYYTINGIIKQIPY